MTEEKKEFKYVQFPLCLLMETYKDDIEAGLRLILRYGIMNYATKQNYTLPDVAQQVAYYYYRKSDIMQASIFEEIETAIEDSLFTPDEHYNGFDGHGKFDPELNTTELLQMFDKDEQFKNACILNYQIHLATSKDHLGVNLASHEGLIESYNRAKQIKDSFEGKFGPDAMPSCKKSMLFEFIENPQYIDLFRAYIGISSMIGRRNFISSNKPAILSRMIGCKNKAAFIYYTTDRYNKNKDLLPTVEKYSKRYPMDKLLLSLAEHKYIMFLSKEKVSVIYLSKYMEPEELANLIREAKNKLNIKKRIKDITASL